MHTDRLRIQLRIKAVKCNKWSDKCQAHPPQKKFPKFRKSKLLFNKMSSLWANLQPTMSTAIYIMTSLSPSIKKRMSLFVISAFIKRWMIFREDLTNSPSPAISARLSKNCLMKSSKLINPVSPIWTRLHHVSYLPLLNKQWTDSLNLSKHRSVMLSKVCLKRSRVQPTCANLNCWWIEKRQISALVMRKYTRRVGKRLKTMFRRVAMELW